MEEAQQQGDPVAQIIAKLKLDSNRITLRLEDVFDEAEQEDEEENESPADAEDDGAGAVKGAESASDMEDSDDERDAEARKTQQQQSGKRAGKPRKPAQKKYMLVDVDLEQTAFANARQVSCAILMTEKRKGTHLRHSKNSSTATRRFRPSRSRRPSASPSRPSKPPNGRPCSSCARLRCDVCLHNIGLSRFSCPHFPTFL